MLQTVSTGGSAGPFSWGVIALHGRRMTDCVWKTSCLVMPLAYFSVMFPTADHTPQLCLAATVAFLTPFTAFSTRV